jgi:hypothetical protein
MLTRILHGILNRQLEPLIATKAIACCRVAAPTFPRPAAVARLRPATHPDTAEAVPIISTDGAGNLIGPRVLYEGTTDWGQAPPSEIGCDRTFLPSHEPRAKFLDDPRYLADPNASTLDSADEPPRVWDPAEVEALYREATDAIERGREAGKLRLKAWEERLRKREMYDREAELLNRLPRPLNPSPVVSSHLISDPREESGDDPAGLNLQAAAEPVHAAGCRPQAAGCRLQAAGCRLSSRCQICQHRYQCDSKGPKICHPKKPHKLAPPAQHNASPKSKKEQLHAAPSGLSRRTPRPLLRFNRACHLSALF